MDRMLAEKLAEEPSMAIPWFLMASYLYYYEHESLLSDAYFDQLCRFLIERWDTLEHRHKDIIPYEDLSAGTGFAIPKDKYPGMCKSSARSLIRKRDELNADILAVHKPQ